MSNLIFKSDASANVSGGSNVSICVKNGVISEIDADLPTTDGAPRLLRGLRLFPGFIDTHNHGAAGFDVNVTNCDGLVEIGGFLASVGVTSWVPTIVPDDDSNYQRIVAEIKKVLKIQDELPIARIVGIHYEGIFANAQMCGALRPEYFKTYSGNELELLPGIDGIPHIVTYAPEIVGGIELTRAIVNRGWIPSIGHTKATTDILASAFAAGARRFTHLFNAMSGIHHRDIGVAGFALIRSDAECEIIADGIHVHPEMLMLTARLKSSAKLCLVSDCVAPTGLGDGHFDLWNERIIVESGRTRNERGSIAGSVTTVADGVKFYGEQGISLRDLALMSSGNASRTLGIDNSTGSIHVGKRADLVGLDEDWKVRFVMIGGRVLVDEFS